MAECPSCQNPIESEDKFCRNCGHRIGSAPEGRFRAILPSTTEEKEQARGFFRSFFIVTLMFVGGLSALALLVQAIGRYLSGR